MPLSTKPAIEIVASQASWAAEFDAIAVRLADAFGPLALAIEHIGSTSVPGLPAKDIIDVQVSVTALDLPDILSDRLSFAGFTLLEGTWTDHVPLGAESAPSLWSKRYAGAAESARGAHLHIRGYGAPNERYALLFEIICAPRQPPPRAMR